MHNCTAVSWGEVSFEKSECNKPSRLQQGGGHRIQRRRSQPAFDNWSGEIIRAFCSYQVMPERFLMFPGISFYDRRLPYFRMKAEYGPPPKLYLRPATVGQRIHKQLPEGNKTVSAGVRFSCLRGRLQPRCEAISMISLRLVFQDPIV